MVRTAVFRSEPVSALHFLGVKQSTSFPTAESNACIEEDQQQILQFYERMGRERIQHPFYQRKKFYGTQKCAAATELFKKPFEFTTAFANHPSVTL